VGLCRIGPSELAEPALRCAFNVVRTTLAHIVGIREAVVKGEDIAGDTAKSRSGLFLGQLTHDARRRKSAASRTGHARLRRKTWVARSPATYFAHS
jgi:hypothetical protein